MAHFAELDENNVVLRILVVDDSQEHRGQEFLANDLGLGGTWIQTSYFTRRGVNSRGATPLRKNFAQVGGTYDEGRDAFIPPKEYASWVLDEQMCDWQPPIECPNKRAHYLWDEPTRNWILVSSRLLDYDQEW
jgi:hypothetical protein